MMLSSLINMFFTLASMYSLGNRVQDVRSLRRIWVCTQGLSQTAPSLRFLYLLLDSDLLSHDPSIWQVLVT